MHKLCKMRMKNLLTIFIVASTIVGCSILGGKANLTKSQINGVYIPKDLDDAISELNKNFSDSLKTEIKKMTENDFSSRFHMGTGMWMRNNWRLWAGSRLSVYFNELGIYHPDDMSGIILDSYYRTLNEKPIELEKQTEYYKQYWLVVRKPEEKNFPEGVKTLEFNTGMYYDKPDKKPAMVHVQTNSDNEMIWLYDYYWGWKQVNKSQVDLLGQKQENRFELLKKIYEK